MWWLVLVVAVLVEFVLVEQISAGLVVVKAEPVPEQVTQRSVVQSA